MSNSPSSKSNRSQRDWYAIACKIRKQNEELKDKINQLESIIEEQKQQIRVQVIKNKDHEKKILDLENEVNEKYLKINEKKEQYEKQKSVIENLTKELKKTQQLAANLERDCSLLQDNYNESQYLLKQKEKENKELYTRLQRQQRYNAQYKTALDQYLTNSTTSANVNSLGVKSWSENNLSSSNEVKNNLENNSLLDKIDEEIASIDDNLEKNMQSIEQNNVENQLTEQTKNNNPFLPALKQDKNSPDNSHNHSNNSHPEETPKPRRQSFLKLPKFGK